MSWRWLTVPEAKLLPDPGAMKLPLEGMEVALFHIGGAYYAVQNACPHRGGPLADGSFEGTHVVCPWHAWLFDVAEGRSVYPPGLTLERYEVREEDGEIQVRVPAEWVAGAGDGGGETGWPLRIEGAVAEPRSYSFEALLDHPEHGPIGRLAPGWEGDAIPLRALLHEAGLRPEATHVTFHAVDGYAASIELEKALPGAAILFAQGGEPLARGGPARLLIPDLDDPCANVKGLCRIELTVGKGKDTKPQGAH